MRRSILLVSALGLSMVMGYGCSRQNQGERTSQEQQPYPTPGGATSANERQNVGGSQTGATNGQNQNQNQNTGNTGMNENERQPVAGKEVTPLATKLKNQLGDEWMVNERGPGTFAAMRKTPSRGGSDLAKNVRDKVHDVNTSGKGVTATYNGTDEVSLRGSTKDCDDAADMADKFAKIDGVNRIQMNVNCMPPSQK